MCFKWAFKRPYLEENWYTEKYTVFPTEFRSSLLIFILIFLYLVIFEEFPSVFCVCECVCVCFNFRQIISLNIVWEWYLCMHIPLLRSIATLIFFIYLFCIHRRFSNSDCFDKYTICLFIYIVTTKQNNRLCFSFWSKENGKIHTNRV